MRRAFPGLQLRGEFDGEVRTHVNHLTLVFAKDRWTIVALSVSAEPELGTTSLVVEDPVEADPAIDFVGAIVVPRLRGVATVPAWARIEASPPLLASIEDRRGSYCRTSC